MHNFGCKAGQIDRMKLNLDVLYHLPNVYNKFQIDISKHVKKVFGRTDIATA